MTVSKKVTEGDKSRRFSFTAKLTDGAFPARETGADYTIDDDGVVHFGLADGESVTIKVPVDAEVTVTEVDADGYAPIIKLGDAVLANGNTASLEVKSETEITVVNTSGYELPNTGGRGTLIYTLLGLALIAASLMRCQRGRF